MNNVNDHFYRMLEIGAALTAQKSNNKLLRMILTESRAITNCDAGTLYVKEKDNLVFKVMENETLNIYKGENNEPIDLPAIDINSNSVSAYVARTKKVVNIEDIYKENNELLEYSKKYDSITGYHTQSMLVLPVMDQEENVIAVMQLINARNNEGKVIPFIKYHEKIILYHSSQVAIYMTNQTYLEQIHKLFSSFISTMVGAIDRKAKYNGNHTKNIVRILNKFIKYINKSKNPDLAKHHFDDKRRIEIETAAWLHDIGKIDIPLVVMNKATRLAERLENVIYKIKLEIKEVELAQLKNLINEKEAKSRIDFLIEAIELINQCNNPRVTITEDLLQKLKYIYNYEAIGENKKLFTKNEFDKITTRKGSLTDEERQIMNSHVAITREMLKGIPFTEDLKHVKDWASMHHELLDGSGYPNGLRAFEIPFEARLLTILDIFEALISRDRPYKEPMSAENALKVLNSMAEEGKLDSMLVEEFEKSKAWE